MCGEAILGPFRCVFFEAAVKNFSGAIRRRPIDLTTNTDRQAIERSQRFTRATAVGNGESSPQNERLGARRQLGGTTQA
jgi:hypothetical protein